MKLTDGFITHVSDGEQIMVAVGDAADQFHGLVRSNKTAAFIIDCLKQEHTKEQIVDAVLAKFNASRDVVTGDVDKIIADLREIGAIS
ncbi:MAG: PqqD family protein [Velocimicrobium sp.]